MSAIVTNQKMSTRHIGNTLIIVAFLSLVWYFCCPIVSISGVKEWRRDPVNDVFPFAEKASFVLTRDPDHFWPGLAIIWPAAFGISLLIKSRIPEES